MKHDQHAVATLRAAVLSLIYHGPAGADRRPLTEAADAIEWAIIAILAEAPRRRPWRACALVALGRFSRARRGRRGRRP